MRTYVRYTGAMAAPVTSPASFPRRDEGARTRLTETARRAQPVTLARERVLTVPGELGSLVPGGSLQRGTTVTVNGAPGAGATSIALSLAAAATATGEWAGSIDRDGTLGAEAAAATGVVLARFAVVRRVPPARWAAALAALLDGVALVVTDVPRHAHAADARRLVARARERGTVLVVLSAPGARWPAEASLHLHADGGRWLGLAAGAGLLAERAARVRVEQHGRLAHVG